MLTYNQEQFIAQTIESILMQETNFNYQLVIGEDASTDTTLAICQSYATRFPEKVLLLPAEKNMGLIANFMRTLKECVGTYIAICDGDDYWTDVLKLQKQVDWLEGHQEYKMVYTLKKDLLPDGTFEKSAQLIKPVTTGFEDLVLDNYIPSVTVLFKNKTLEQSPPDWIVNFPYGDWPLYLWTLADGGKIYFMDEVTAAYRTQIGASFALRKKLSDAIAVKLEILKFAYKDPAFVAVRSLIKKSKVTSLKALMRSFNREKSYLKGAGVFLRIMLTDPSFETFKMYFYTLYKRLT